MAECGVCWEIFEKKGRKCPKLLPCIHTLCFSCLTILETNGEIQCPYCRTIHQIPSEHIESLPTNYRLLTHKRKKKIYTLPSSGVQPQRKWNWNLRIAWKACNKHHIQHNWQYTKKVLWNLFESGLYHCAWTRFREGWLTLLPPTMWTKQYSHN